MTVALPITTVKTVVEAIEDGGPGIKLFTLVDPGHWELPPYRGSSWIAPHVEQEGDAYRFNEGHWN